MVTKILVNHLKSLMLGFISQNQNSFTKGWGSETNLVIATEILHSMSKKKENTRWFALKIEKAYNRMELSFIEKCLKEIGLDRITIKSIINCIKRASSSILLNGRKGERFVHCIGLRQGDSMSPYVFNICLKYLTNMINSACNVEE